MRVLLHTGSGGRGPATRKIGGLSVSIFLALVATAQALTPPRETHHTIGTDSKGVVWRVTLAVEEPMLVSGARNFPVKTKEPFDLFEIHAAMDSHGTAWIVDGKGRGVRINLADGAAEEFRVPVSMQLVGGIAVREGKLFYGDSGGTAGRTVRRMDVASGATETLMTLGAGWSVYEMVPGKNHLWIAAWTGFAPSRHNIELTALDWTGGNVVLQSRRELGWADPRWSTFEVVEAEDGAAWVATGHASRVERLDASGTWQGWSLEGRTPSKLVPARFGAVCLLEQLQVAKGPQPPGAPSEGPTVLRREIAAFQPGSSAFVTCPVEADANLSVDGEGGVRVEGRGRLSLEGGRLQIVP